MGKSSEAVVAAADTSMVPSVFLLAIMAVAVAALEVVVSFITQVVMRRRVKLCSFLLSSSPLQWILDEEGESASEVNEDDDELDDAYTPS